MKLFSIDNLEKMKPFAFEFSNITRRNKILILCFNEENKNEK